MKYGYSIQQSVLQRTISDLQIIKLPINTTYYAPQIINGRD